MLKKNLKTLIITSIITLLPMIIGIVLWNRLPEEIATHFGMNGEPNDWSSKAVTVFGMPLFLLFIQLLCAAATGYDPKNKHISDKMFKLILWIMPVVSIFTNAGIYAYALGYSVDIAMSSIILCGILFIVVGNYMPKMKQSYTLGIKLPWTLESEENWNKTHRLGGWVFMIGGIVTIILSFTSMYWMFFIIMIVIIIIPTIYSFCLHKKGI